jgi:hypothetical protein
MTLSERAGEAVDNVYHAGDSVVARPQGYAVAGNPTGNRGSSPTPPWGRD